LIQAGYALDASRRIVSKEANRIFSPYDDDRHAGNSPKAPAANILLFQVVIVNLKNMAHSMLSKKLNKTHKNRKKETAMKSILTNTTWILIMIAGSAFADTGAGAAEDGWLWMLFLGFASVIVVFQLVPSMILCGAMLKGLFSTAAKEGAPAAEANGTTKS
jgi:hypothetical protein